MKQVTIIRAVLELDSPLSMGTGEDTDLRDTTVFTDASGCPMISGTGFAGVLRAAWREWKGEAAANALFGACPEGIDDANTDSILNVSCGVVHDENDIPVKPCQTPSQMSDFVRASRSVTTRQHVRIDDKGTAAKRGLYDRDMVPKGHRFTVELRFNWLNREEHRGLDIEAIPKDILSLLQSPFMTLGGRSRTGLGQFSLKRAWMRSFDLTHRDEFDAFCAVPVALWEQAEAEQALLNPVVLQGIPVIKRPGWATLTIAMRPRKSWLIAGNTPTNEDIRPINGGNIADMVPWREAQVEWQNEYAVFDPTNIKVAVPASSIKGPLRHRTAFYLNAAVGNCFSSDSGVTESERKALDAQNNTELWSLFGGIPFKDIHKDNQKQVVGKLIVEDVELRNKGEHGFQDHVSLDRFRGGALSGHLFDESFHWGGLWLLKLHIKDPNNLVPSKVRHAFGRALEDLQEGCLQIGAGDARGHGRMNVIEMRWSDGEEWLKGTPQAEPQGEAA